MRIGIDLGGTKIEGVVLDDSGQESGRLRVPTPRDDYQATVAAIADVVVRLEQMGRAALGPVASAAVGPASVGLGIPGVVSPATGLVKNSNSTWIIGHPLDRDIERVLGRPVRVANDANCFALSEAVDGAGAVPGARASHPGPRVVFGVIVGTGTGGGVAVDRQVLTGPNAIAGEWGHNPLPWMRAEEFPGPDCYCGKRGCIETFLSGPGLARDHLRATGQALDGPTIVAHAQAGDAVAAATLDRYEDRMARALASVLNVLDPDVVVLGGGLSKIERLYQNVPRLWGQYTFSDSISTALRPPLHGDASGVRGAAWLWPETRSEKGP
jgi:fructokinase